jgi:hypothetical protein
MTSARTNLSNGYRHLQEAPDTVVLVGTGAVRNSWEPVRRALLRHHRFLPEGEENLAFATIILDLRHRAAVCQASWRMYLRSGWRAPYDRWLERKKLSQQIRRYHQLKVDIATELRAAAENGGIRVRPEAVDCIRSWLEPAGSYVIITTNWDLALEDDFDASRIYHLHGHVLDPPSLYLPTEQSWEGYRYFVERGFTVPRDVHVITHGNWLATRVNRLAVVGLSLSPLDSELRSLLMSASDAGRRPIAEAMVFDVTPEPVGRRLLYLTHGGVTNLTLRTPSAPTTHSDAMTR